MPKHATGTKVSLSSQMFYIGKKVATFFVRIIALWVLQIITLLSRVHHFSSGDRSSFQRHFTHSTKIMTMAVTITMTMTMTMTKSKVHQFLSWEGSSLQRHFICCQQNLLNIYALSAHPAFTKF